MENTIKSHNPITYSLRLDKNKTDFYSELDEYRRKLINKAKIEYFGTVSAYQNYVEEFKIEKPRQWEEYFLELLMLGVYWNIYSPHISSRTKIYKFIFDRLYSVRMKNKTLKPFTDKIRGNLATKLLSRTKNENPAFEQKNIKLLLCWMDCTKEFTEEVKRLNNWVLFFRLNPNVFQHVQKSLADFAVRFEEQSKRTFGAYTSNVNKYLDETHPKNKNQENYFFTGRKEVEYHLNMVGASILNHILQKEFHESKNKVVLLPTCMRSGKTCKAKKVGFDMFCTHCTPSCNVSTITKELSEKNIKTVLIPHSSKFTEYLISWANQKETGLVGVACILNLLRGGYEMMNLNIPSQCVFLDYCGCKKHWGRSGGVATSLDLGQLKKLLHIDDLKRQLKKQFQH